MTYPMYTFLSFLNEFSSPFFGVVSQKKKKKLTMTYNALQTGPPQIYISHNSETDEYNI